MDAVWKNLVYSARMLLKRTSLTAVAIIAIALGIGANTAIFSVVNTVLLQPLPYDEPQQLLNLATEQRNQALEGPGTMITEGGEPERVLGAAVSADYFSVLRVKPVMGRVFTRDEDKAGAPS